MTGVRILEYNIGDLVYYYQPSIKLFVGSKYAHPWVGPYRILSKVSDRNYVLKIGESSVTNNIDRIKPCRGVFNETDKTNVGKTDKSSGNVEYCVGSGNDSDNTDSDSDETCAGCLRSL